MHAHTWRELLFFIYSVYRAVCTLPGPQVGKNHQIKCPPPPRVFHLSPLQTSLSGEALQVITSCPEAPGPASLASHPGASPPQNWHYLEWGSRCAAHLQGLSLGRRAPCGPGCITLPSRTEAGRSAVKYRGRSSPEREPPGAPSLEPLYPPGWLWPGRQPL